MVHCNNCTAELDGWVKLFGEFASALGSDITKGKLYDLLYEKAIEGEADCGGVIAYNYLSGEHITALSEGRPMYLRTSDSHLTLANFMRAELYSALATLKIGMNLLFTNEHVALTGLFGHGGFF